ncbi:MAG: hypothetical protein KFH87_05055 [Bacteroidetes bacterium]|nr:hypothetical protein [Bacteroidota bacterium]
MTVFPLPYIIAIIIAYGIPAGTACFTLESDEAIKLVFTREHDNRWEMHTDSDAATPASGAFYGSIHIEDDVLTLLSDHGESRLDLRRLGVPGDTAKRSSRDTIDIDGFRFSIDRTSQGMDLRLGSATDPGAPVQLFHARWEEGE